MKSVYLSGKITGLPYEEAYNNFRDSGDLTRSIFEESISVVNPMMEVPYVSGKTWERYMIDDIKLLFACDTVCMLVNWKESKGSRIEHNIAIEMGKNVIYLPR